MNIYRYEFEYKVYNSDGLEIDKGIETSKGYNEFHAENSLRIRLEEGAESDEDFFSVKLIPTFVKYTDANKLIAEFMGLIESSIPNKYWTEQAKEGFGKGELVELDYHTSWDWLMPVVKRIVSDVEFDVGYENEYREHLMDVVPFANIEDVYEAVVEFIKNQNN
jgi:hypothetical protein